MTNGHLFVVIIMSSRCLPSCSSELSVLLLAGLTHLTIIVKFKVSNARFKFEESTYWFVKTRGICWRTGLWRQYPLVEEHFLHRQVQELHALMTSLISDFGCIIFMFMF